MLHIQKNRYGHYVLSFSAERLSGHEEIARIVAAGLEVEPNARYLLGGPEYPGHQLTEQTYQVALIPTVDRRNPWGFTSEELFEQVPSFGYGRPVAGLVASLSRIIPKTWLEDRGLWYITAPHDPLKCTMGRPNLLRCQRGYRGWSMRSFWSIPRERWIGAGLLALPVLTI